MEILGYEFRNAALLEEALTAPSVKIDRPRVRDNQRLEFLGDAVLGFLSAEFLYANHPKEEEGLMTICRSQMVSTAALCKVAIRHGLRERLKRNKGAGTLPSNAKTLADAVEAVMGAVYLDGGFAAARRVFDALDLVRDVRERDWHVNPKGELQIRAQALTPRRRPVYELLERAGKPHDPVFRMKVSVEGVGEATASAKSVKEAEARAAANLLACWAGA